MTMLLACLLVGCNNSGENKNEPKEEPEKSVAKESTWDLCLIGSWRYEDVGDEQSAFPRGIECFYASGDYVCWTEDEKGKKVVINGTWKLDDEEEFVVWVTQNTVENAKGTISDEPTKFKYVINMLAPESEMSYQCEQVFRSAEYLGQ